ncbi:uncharacterized protein LOC128744216 [Sabethes cyaneus]|uniref:uncharacterized protein LOC128744216 n=1 Tax=Sabethes cyaneus TaxID=53552 RepID=UPI00237DAA3C|nr:uncharacterized protein LOC128744216 [Sabethes cyaneus]
MYCDKKRRLLTSVVIFIGTLQATDAFGWNWIWPFTTTTSTTQATAASSGASSSNYAISIGNRENTNAETVDYGTNISNLQINLARFNGTSIGSGTAVQDALSRLINSVTHEYRTQSEGSVARRLALIQDTISQAHHYATELREGQIKNLLTAFAKDTRASVNELNQTVRNCLEREVQVEDVIQSVVDRSQDGCIETRMRLLYELHNTVRNNLTNFLNAAEDVEDLLGPCVDDVQDYFDDEMSDLQKVACIASVLLKTQTETYRLDFTINQLTADADPLLGVARANLLQCAAGLASYAFEASLGLRQWINFCSNRVN